MIEKKDFYGRDLVSIDDFSIDEINYVIDFAKEISKNPKKFRESMKYKMMAPLFFEKSTRTIGSFQTAMIKMGGCVFDFDVDLSSLGKGERFRDTLEMIGGYEPDIVVIRHHEDGSAKLAADILDAPLINAGDGKNQHPTQTLLDLYTIFDINGEISNTKIVMVGDLKLGRTVHSLAESMSNYSGCEMVFVSPPSLKMPKSLLDRLREKKVSFSEKGLENFESSIKDTDILYMTRIQRERFPEGLEGEQEYRNISKKYHLNASILKNVKSDFKIMHPLPRVDELDQEVDNTKYAYYFQQAKNGLYVRKALLELLVGENG